MLTHDAMYCEVCGTYVQELEPDLVQFLSKNGLLLKCRYCDPLVDLVPLCLTAKWGEVICVALEGVGGVSNTLQLKDTIAKKTRDAGYARWVCPVCSVRNKTPFGKQKVCFTCKHVALLGGWYSVT